MPIKSVKQKHTSNSDQIKMMQTFSEMVNHCIRIGLENNYSTMKKLSLLSYQQLKGYHIQSKYKLTAISQAAGRLAQMKKDIKKGNGQGRKFRRKMNSTIPNYEIQRQVTYKAAWEGIQVELVDPRRTSKLCPICGEKLQEDRLNRRKLLCSNCDRIMDRDAVASMNVAHKGWARFTHPGGLPDEAVKGNVVSDKYQEPLILRVHGSKLVTRSV